MKHIPQTPISVNVPEILSLISFLEDLPDKSFDMGRYTDLCHTSGCIAGWQCIRHEIDLFTYLVDNELHTDLNYGEYLVVAGHMLDLSRSQAIELFEPNHLMTQNGGPGLSHITKQQATTVLKHLAQTGKVDWSIVFPAHCWSAV